MPLMRRSNNYDRCKKRSTKKNHNNVVDNPSIAVSIPYLQIIPVEIFLHICSFLDISFLSDTLSKVCKRFQYILSDKKLWQKWVHKRLKNSYPAPHLDTNEFDWADAGAKLYKEFKRWSSNNTMRHILINYTPIRTILLKNNAALCVCGGMGKKLSLWRVPEINCYGHKTLPIKIRRDAHEEWVSGLATDNSYDNFLVHSASGDGTIKSWDLSTSLTCIKTYECNNAAFSIANCGPLIVAGLISKVQLFDQRAGQRPINTYTAHKDAVSILETHNNYVVSASYDRTFAVWDKRMCGLLKSNKTLPNCDRACPISLKWADSSIYVGDNMGSLHLFNVNNFDSVASYRLWGEMDPADRVTCLTHNSSLIICCSAQGEVKFLFPSNPPEEFNTLLSSSQYITGVQYQNDVLAICSHNWQPENCNLEFWIPV